MRLVIGLAALLLGSTIALADTVYVNGRGMIKGRIVREDERQVVVRLPTGGQIEIDREDIDRIERGLLPAEEFEQRLTRLDPKDARGHYELALWAKDQREPELYRAQLERVIAIDPDHIEARTALGYSRAAGGWERTPPAQEPKTTGNPAPPRVAPKTSSTSSRPPAQPPADKGLRLRQRALAHWEAARAEALGVIFDLQRYPDADHGAAGQPLVDAGVAAVREAFRQLDALEQSDLAALLRQAKRDGRDAREILSGGGAWEARILAHLERERVRQRNLRVSAATEDERRQAEITNDYRYLMGRTPLDIDARLTQAARGHSAEMAALRYFSHDSPTAGLTSPGDRARAAGYEGPVSENIYMGRADPQSAHDGWYRSSGHHRNILDPDHRCMGVGQHRDHWTQNFGVGAAVDR